MNYKVLDQFEVESNAMYSGSYTDLMFSGSVLAGNRRVIASHSSGSDELRLARNYSDFSDYSGRKRTRNLGSALRFRHFVSTVERYQDTILPDIKECYLLNGGQLTLALAEYVLNPILKNDPASLLPSTAAGKMVFTTFGVTASYSQALPVSSDGTIAGDAIWFASSPFQGRYSNATRNLELDFYQSRAICTASESQAFGGAIVRYGQNMVEASASLLTAEVIIPLQWHNLSVLDPGNGKTEPFRHTLIDVTGAVNTSEQFISTNGDLYPPAAPGNFYWINGTVRPQNKNLVKFLFGFGDNYQGVPVASGVSSSFLASTIGVPNGFYPSSIDIRGWRYGVASGFPYYSTCVFRSSRYGQLRDMFEQRKFTKFFNPDGFTVDGKNNGKRGSTEAAVTVKYLSGSNSFVTASNPLTLNANDSGIYDFECKSGQPWTDV